ncbi:MAG: MBL fold metallo-hydrolase [Mariniphaga sp.]|nr:MBL fold metallo-hydrolase [Mariniphaga sp.]
MKVVLSHGHYDHTGGLYPFLKKNSKAKIYVKEGIFTPKYSCRTRFIGTPFNEELLKNRLVYVDAITEITENIFIMPDIDIYNSIDTHFKGMNIKMNNDFIPDEFDDELFHQHCDSLFAPGYYDCATASQHFKLPVSLVLGGFHMKECSDEQYDQILHYFQLFKPESIGVCHCTGVEKFAEL